MKIRYKFGEAAQQVRHKHQDLEHKVGRNVSQLADQGEQNDQGHGEVEDQVGHHPQEDGSPLEDFGEDARGPPDILTNQTCFMYL